MPHISVTVISDPLQPKSLNTAVLIINVTVSKSVHVYMDRFHSNWAPKIQYYVEKWRSTGCARNSAIYQTKIFPVSWSKINAIHRQNSNAFVTKNVFPWIPMRIQTTKITKTFPAWNPDWQGGNHSSDPHPTPRQRHFEFAPQSHIYIKNYIYMIHKRGDIDLISTFQGKDCVTPHTVSCGISFLILILAYMFKSARAIIIHTSEHFPPSSESS